jgi:HK97 family phage prohead protease
MPIVNNREYRGMVFEVRSADTEDEQMIVEGYATRFNTPYQLYAWDGYEVNEQIDAHAFDDCDMTDTIMQYDHQGRVFARVSNKTLQLEVDQIGLKVTADLGGTEEGRKLYEEIKGGYTTKMSFGFIVKTDERKSEYDHEYNKTVVLRTITAISKLYDVSAVSIPANDATEISARSFSDGVIREAKAERLKREIKRSKLMAKMRGIK